MSHGASRGGRAARLARAAAAALVLAAAFFGLLSSSEGAKLIARILAAVQLFPAADRAAGAIVSGVAAGACVAAVAILGGTALFGRWYCAFLCPLGTLQDLASLPRRKRRAFIQPLQPLRIAVLVAAVAASALGAASLASWVDPWSLFARFSAYDLKSLLGLARKEDLLGFEPLIAAASAAMMIGILAASLLSGRWFCGNVCPVGAILGGLNALSPLRLRLDAGACISCGACAAKCLASCIDAEGKRLDPTRCVGCLACVPSCPIGAIGYGPRRASGGERPRGMTRAAFLGAAGGGIAALALATLPKRAIAAPPVLPPGARSVDEFLGACVACSLCVDHCPSKVLQPSLGQLGLVGFMVPRLDHAISYCQFDCTACMDLCPSGALEKLGLEGKRIAKIGDATLVRDKCVVFTNRTKCGACAEHCPTGAVRMIQGETGLPEPVFTSSICIGCGACHHACPVRPERAITVAGLAVQGRAEKPSDELFSAPRQGGGSDEGFPF